MSRWLVFNAVGVFGAVLQLTVLAVLVHGVAVHYLLATVAAVECAVLHNFLWHERWTWRDRPAGSRAERLSRLVRFHLLNGAVSFAGNVALMAILSGRFGLTPVVANIAAVTACSLVNFAGSEWLVFRTTRRAVTAALLILTAVPAPARAADEFAIELKPATLAAWRVYEQTVEQRYRRLSASASPFFVHDEFGVKDWRATVRGGRVAMTQVDAPAPGAGRPIFRTAVCITGWGPCSFPA